MNRRYPLVACRFFAAVGLGAMCLAVADRGFVARAAEPQWLYVVPKAGDPMEHPPLRELSLSRGNHLT